MISKTQINKRVKKKRNPEIVETINLAVKNNLIDLAKMLSAPRSQQKIVNMEDLNKIKEDKILIVGKVLGVGEINRKLNVAALGFSKQAAEKLSKNGGSIKSIKVALEKNPKLKGVKIL